MSDYLCFLFSQVSGFLSSAGMAVASSKLPFFKRRDFFFFRLLNQAALVALNRILSFFRIDRIREFLDFLKLQNKFHFERKHGI